ncbi:MAG: protoporphyrinogen oxidase [Pyrinomonadaceae bacterium]|nr:protoporphyrinogen oxidase [Pyrinomonadaceae bacterium]
MSKFVIIGGGISGLSAAHRLREAGEDFVLLEASNRFGGVIRSIKKDGFLLESGADSFLSEKPQVVDLARKLNIENELIETNDDFRRSFLVRENKLRAVPEGFRLIAPSNLETFFASEIVSESGKTQIANEQFLPAQTIENIAKSDESLADFVRRRFGQEALERIAQPMFAGIYTANPEKLSVKATQPKFLELEQKFGSVIAGLQQTTAQINPITAINSAIGEETEMQSQVPSPKSQVGTSGARYSLFLSFRNGMQTLLDALVESLPSDSIRLNAKVRSLRFDGSRKVWQIVVNDEVIEADKIILAVSTFVSAQLLQNQFPDIANELNSIEYASTATVNFAFRREQIKHKLDGFGFVVPFVEKRTLMACTFSSVKFPERAPENHALLRAFVGGVMQPETFALNEDAMINGALQDLRELLGIEGEPIFSTVEKWADSMPQYNVGHLDKASRINDLLMKIPNLRLATNAFDGVGVPDCIRHGITAAEELLNN